MSDAKQVTFIEAQKAFNEYLDRYGGEVNKLTPEKVRTRAELVDDDDYPDRIVIEVEQHKAILSETYSRGVGMRNFATYWWRYALDPETGECDCWETERPWELHINPVAVAENWDDHSVSIKEGDSPGTYVVREGMCGIETVVSSCSELDRFAAKVVGTLDFSLAFMGIADHISQTELGEHLDRIKKELKRRIYEKAVDTWEDEIGDC